MPLQFFTGADVLALLWGELRSQTAAALTALAQQRDGKADTARKSSGRTQTNGAIHSCHRRR